MRKGIGERINIFSKDSLRQEKKLLELVGQAKFSVVCSGRKVRKVLGESCATLSEKNRRSCVGSYGRNLGERGANFLTPLVQDAGEKKRKHEGSFRGGDGVWRKGDEYIYGYPSDEERNYLGFTELTTDARQDERG